MPKFVYLKNMDTFINLDQVVFFGPNPGSVSPGDYLLITNNNTNIAINQNYNTPDFETLIAAMIPGETVRKVNDYLSGVGAYSDYIA